MLLYIHRSRCIRALARIHVHSARVVLRLLVHAVGRPSAYRFGVRARVRGISRRSMHDRVSIAVLRRLRHDIEQTRAPLSLAHVRLSDEVFLRVRRHLRWRPRRDKVSRDPSPIALSKLL